MCSTLKQTQVRKALRVQTSEMRSVSPCCVVLLGFLFFPDVMSIGTVKLRVDYMQEGPNVAVRGRAEMGLNQTIIIPGTFMIPS